MHSTAGTQEGALEAAGCLPVIPESSSSFLPTVTHIWSGRKTIIDVPASDRQFVGFLQSDKRNFRIEMDQADYAKE